jgi:hypothetical protein
VTTTTATATEQQRPGASLSELQETLKYRTLQLFAAPTYGKVLAVLAVAAPILLLGSALYRKTAEGGDTSWSEAILKPYSVLLNCPGASVRCVFCGGGGGGGGD